MTRETLSATFQSMDQARNAEDELRAAGVPREQIYVAEPGRQREVIMPGQTRRGIAEMLQRHGLTLRH